MPDVWRNNTFEQYYHRTANQITRHLLIHTTPLTAWESVLLCDMKNAVAEYVVQGDKSIVLSSMRIKN